jgi:Adenosylmethionine-8-amino-7-oxononanoate aminotransferase
MAATLGHGRRDIIEAARVQAGKLAYAHNERLTNPLQERRDELIAVAPEGFGA